MNSLKDEREPNSIIFQTNAQFEGVYVALKAMIPGILRSVSQITQVFNKQINDQLQQTMMFHVRPNLTWCCQIGVNATCVFALCSAKPRHTRPLDISLDAQLISYANIDQVVASSASRLDEMISQNLYNHFGYQESLKIDSIKFVLIQRYPGPLY